MSARNGGAVKTKGPAADTPLPKGMSASQREIAALKKELAEVRQEGKTTAWLLAQLLYEMRVATLKQVMSTPEGQEAIAQKLMAEMNGQVG